MTRLRLVLAALVIAALAFTLAACGSDSSSASSGTDTTSASDVSCAKDQLTTLNAGTLTVGTDKPAYPPYLIDDDPTNGKGFESAVAYAVADKLGFTKDEVKWTVVPFNASYAPGAEEVRLRHQPDLDQPTRAKAGRFLDAVLHDPPGRSWR